MLDLILYSIESLEEPGKNTNFLDCSDKTDGTFLMFALDPGKWYKEQLLPTNFFCISTINREQKINYSVLIKK